MARASLYFICLVLLFVIGSNGDQEFPKEGEVLVLTDENCENAIQSIKQILVMFYASWCGYSQAMQNDFTEAAKNLTDEGSPMKLAKINCPENSKMQSKFGISGYPTLKYFKDGKVSNYTGDRTAKSIISFAESHS